MADFYEKKKMATGFSISMSAQLDNIDLACRDVDEYLRSLQLQEFSFDIQLGIREALANAVKHGSQYDQSKQIVFQLYTQNNRLVVTVKDEGRGLVNYGSKVHDGPILSCCGRGITIMHQYFDEVTYNKQGNEVKLIKKNLGGTVS